MNNKQDPFFKKIIPFEFKEHNLFFKVSQDLFSSQDIDKGTQRLLRTFLLIDIQKYKKILDLGCGYGPIGISLKIDSPQSEVHMVDHDALALEYSRQNAELNNVNVKVYATLGYDNVPDRNFDLIISNIPAKVGDNVLRHMLLDAQYNLVPNGMVAIVVIDSILEQTKKILASNPNTVVSFQKSWPGHTVFHYGFLSTVSLKDEEDFFSKGLYNRNKDIFSFDNKCFIIETTYNLPEFDTLSYETRLLLDNLDFLKKQVVNNVIVFNPNQGHVAVLISNLNNPKEILLVDRNLQALEVTKKNLIINGYSPDNIVIFHQVGIYLKGAQDIDAVIGILPEKENLEVYEMLLDQSIQEITSTGIIVFASSSTVITLVEKVIHSRKNIGILKRDRVKGKSIILIKRKH